MSASLKISCYASAVAGIGAAACVADAGAGIGDAATRRRHYEPDPHGR